MEQINVINNSLSNALTLVSLTGNSMALKNVKIENTPDISTNGTYAKAWLRNENNIPVLLKPDDSYNSLEVDREISARTTRIKSSARRQTIAILLRKTLATLLRLIIAILLRKKSQPAL